MAPAPKGHGLRWGGASPYRCWMEPREATPGKAEPEAERGALDSLFDQVYAELKRLAHRQLRRGRPGETLSTTAVVHEVYVKLTRSGTVEVRDRGHFLALAARAMRQVIVDVARQRQADKRGGGEGTLLLDETKVSVDGLADQMMALEGALSRLESLDPRLARIVEWRFFGGVSEEEIAEALGLTTRTVRRDWREARAFLYRAMSPAGGEPVAPDSAS